MGGVEALRALVGSLPADLPAAVFVVQHIASGSVGAMGKILDGAGPLPAALAREGEPIERSRIYAAPPDYHLLVAEGKVRVMYGPRENRWRPAIDPLFRSAAVAYSTRVIGVVLTGVLDDGTAGMMAIKQCGGIAVVQHPEDAMYPDMPLSVMDHVQVDHAVPLDEMGSLLEMLVREPATSPGRIPEELRAEVRLMTQEQSHFELDKISEPALTCPECGGPLTPSKSDNISRYRCETGHAFTASSLLVDQSDALERALWAAVRVLDERMKLLAKMAREAREHNRLRSAGDYEERAVEAHRHAEQLRKFLSNNKGRRELPKRGAVS